MENPKLKYLEAVPWDNSLKLSNGKTVHDLEQLPMVIKFSDDEVFYTHVNDQKNDFANWIRDVVGDAELANQLYSIRTKEEFLKFMDQSIIDIKHYKAPEPVVEPVIPTIGNVVLPVTPVVSTVLTPVVPPVPNIVQSIQQPVVPPVVQPIVPAIPQNIVQPVVSSAVSSVVQPVVQPAIIVSTQKSSPFVSESQMVDVPIKDNPQIETPQPVQQKTVETAQIPNAAIQAIEKEKPALVAADKPVDSSSDKSVVVPPVVPPAVPSTSIPATTSENVAAPIEETFEFEEIFKVLIGELEQEVYAWDNQTS